MIFRQLDQNHDWTFGKGKNNFTSQNDAIKLDIKTRLLEWYRDCFFNMSAGIDYPNRLERSQRKNIETDTKRIILTTNNVTELVSFSTSLTDRSFRASYQVRTIFSTTFIDKIEVNV